MIVPSADVPALKRAARTEARRRRADRVRSGPPPDPEAMLALLSPLLDRRPGPVAGFWPLRDEIDLRPLLTLLNARGVTVCLPLMVGDGAPLEFHRWAPGDKLVSGDFGVMEPTAEAPSLIPAVLLVPLLAFDRAGRRLGYGGGYYDRTIALLHGSGPVSVVGAGYAAQEVERVPVDPWDQPLDAVLTERELILIEGA